jgi:hypothetical protein
MIHKNSKIKKEAIDPEIQFRSTELRPRESALIWNKKYLDRNPFQWQPIKDARTKAGIPKPKTAAMDFIFFQPIIAEFNNPGEGAIRYLFLEIFELQSGFSHLPQPPSIKLSGKNNRMVQALSLSSLPKSTAEDKILRLIKIKINLLKSWRKISFYESAQICGKARYLYPDEKKMMLDLFPLLGLPQRGYLLDLMEKYLALPLKISLFFYNLNFGWKELQAPLSLSRELQASLNSFLSKYPASFSVIRDLYQKAEEILMRKKSTEANLLRHLKNFSGKGFIKPNAEHLRDFWEELCFPEEALFHKKLKQALNSLHLPKNSNLSYPPFFEGEKATLSLQFSNRQEFQDILRQLQLISENELLADPFYKPPGTKKLR